MMQNIRMNWVLNILFINIIFIKYYIYKQKFEKKKTRKFKHGHLIWYGGVFAYGLSPEWVYKKTTSTEDLLLS